MRNNSKDETKVHELEQIVEHFANSGYNSEELEALKQKALLKASSNIDTSQVERETLVFPVHYFEGVSEFKSVVQSLGNEISHLIGDVKILFAMKKGSSFGSSLIQNKQISLTNSLLDSQRCNVRNCRQCPLVSDKSKVVVNEKVVHIPRHLNCKSRNIIYMWVCKLCGEKEVYFGRKIQEWHDRTTGHHGCFNDEKWDKSALSMHARDVHPSNFSLDIFTVSVVKKVSPQQIRREEFKAIDLYRTNSLGLNRYKS